MDKRDCRELREEQLRKEKEQLEQQVRMLKQRNNLMMQLMFRKEEWVLVVDHWKGKILYCNKCPERFSRRPQCAACNIHLPFRQQILDYCSMEEEKEWEVSSEAGEWYYTVHSFSVNWEGRPAYAHVIEDTTRDREREAKLVDMAYRDETTGAYNLHYFTEKVKRLLKERSSFSFAFLDLDDLKEVNDTYGHPEGDNYIGVVSTIVEENIRSLDIFARLGGDEFGIIFYECPLAFAETRLKYISELVSDVKGLPYEARISYGVTFVSDKDRKSLGMIMEEADKKMYQVKRLHKKKKTEQS